MLTLLLQQISQFFGYIGAMKNTSFLKPLSKEKELYYLQQLANNDPIAREKLIEHNLRLVAHIVKKYDLHKETQDLISIGTIGLIKAVDSFQLDKGKKLTAYASKCIENEILMHLRSNKNNYMTLSLDDTITSDSDGNSMSLLDSIGAFEDKSIIEKMTIEENKKRLLSCFDVLDEKEREIIEKRYGMNQYKEYKQKEIAKELSISRSYVSRIEKRALMKLYREYLKKENYPFKKEACQ